MKYKKGDRVRIKSRTWWEKVEKEINNTNFISFPLEMANSCCGKLVEIVHTYKNPLLHGYSYRITTNNDWWGVCEDWIEEISIINIHLKQMRNEI